MTRFYLPKHPNPTCSKFNDGGSRKTTFESAPLWRIRFPADGGGLTCEAGSPTQPAAKRCHPGG